LALIFEREETRLKGKETKTFFLNDPSFRGSLFGCALLGANFALGGAAIPIQPMLDTLGVPVFKFALIIDGFVREEGDLGDEFAEHMKAIDDQLLESLVWSDSNLYEVLDSDSSSIPREAISMYLLVFICFFFVFVFFVIHIDSPQSSTERAMLPFGALPVSSSSEAAAKYRASCQLQFLFRKLFCLISTRLALFTQKLEFHQLAIQKAWEILFEVLAEEKKFRLLHTRSLDQVILCCTFVVVKSLAPRDAQKGLSNGSKVVDMSELVACYAETFRKPVEVSTGTHKKKKKKKKKKFTLLYSFFHRPLNR